MYKFFKRFCDIFLSLLAIIILSPVYLFMCIAVAIFLGRPVIFKQPRPGKDGKMFMLYKFRSMSDKRDENGELLPDKERMTKFGNFIRATSLDEIPQFFNILKGDMSLVGPRPQIMKNVIFYPDYAKALKVRPGLTCLASVNGRNNNTWESSIVYDNIYVKRISLGLDLKILFKTVGVVLSREGSRNGNELSPRDLYFADRLLKTGKITLEEYERGIQKAKQLDKEFIDNYGVKNKVKNKVKVYKQAYSSKEEFDLEERTNE